MTLNQQPSCRFVTTNLGLAAYLAASGSLRMLDIELFDPRRAEFVFDDPGGKGKPLEMKFLAGDATVSASAYHHQLRTLRRAMDEKIVAARSAVNKNDHSGKGTNQNANVTLQHR